MKNAKKVDISAKSKDCQLQPMSQARENGISTPLVDSSLMRHSPQLMGDPPDADDADPDVIPNQYGEWRAEYDLPTFDLTQFSFDDAQASLSATTNHSNDDASLD